MTWSRSDGSPRPDRGNEPPRGDGPGLPADDQVTAIERRSENLADYIDRLFGDLNSVIHEPLDDYDGPSGGIYNEYAIFFAREFGDGVDFRPYLPAAKRLVDYLRESGYSIEWDGQDPRGDQSRH